MINPISQIRPLDLNVSMNSLFDIFHGYRHNNIKYEYQKLTMEEPIGALLSIQELIYYPEFAKQIRKLKQLRYLVTIDLSAISTFNQKGLEAITQGFHDIDRALTAARIEKSKLDAEVYNLIFLYGQIKEIPIFQGAKPYYHKRNSTYKRQKTNTFRITISGVDYWINYSTKRFGELTSLFMINEREMLGEYFEATKNDPVAISRHFRFDFLGGVLNTPIYAFRAKYGYKQKGKKYYIDLADNKTYTRISDVKEKAMTYTKKYELSLIKE